MARQSEAKPRYSISSIRSRARRMFSALFAYENRRYPSPNAPKLVPEITAIPASSSIRCCRTSLDVPVPVTFGNRVERASGAAAGDAWERVQALDDHPSALVEGRDHLADAVLRAFERGDARVLSGGVDARVAVHREPGRALHEGLRPYRVSEPPHPVMAQVLLQPSSRMRRSAISG